MSFNFKFSMPIQDTFAFTRDPNRFPAIQSVYSVSDSGGFSGGDEIMLSVRIQLAPHHHPILLAPTD